MEHVEIIEEYFQGKLVNRKINGVDFPPDETEMSINKIANWDEFPDAISERRFMTREEIKQIWGKEI